MLAGIPADAALAWLENPGPFLLERPGPRNGDEEESLCPGNHSGAVGPSHSVTLPVTGFA